MLEDDPLLNEVFHGILELAADLAVAQGDIGVRRLLHLELFGNRTVPLKALLRVEKLHNERRINYLAKAYQESQKLTALQTPSIFMLGSNLSCRVPSSTDLKAEFEGESSGSFAVNLIMSRVSLGFQTWLSFSASFSLMKRTNPALVCLEKKLHIVMQKEWYLRISALLHLAASYRPALRSHLLPPRPWQTYLGPHQRSPSQSSLPRGLIPRLVALVSRLTSSVRSLF